MKSALVLEGRTREEVLDCKIIYMAIVIRGEGGCKLREGARR